MQRKVNSVKPKVKLLTKKDDLAFTLKRGAATALLSLFREKIVKTQRRYKKKYTQCGVITGFSQPAARTPK